MMKLYKFILLSFFGSIGFVCCDNETIDIPSIYPEATGIFSDDRDGYEYHWVRIGGLDWTVENSHYNTGNEINCTMYQPYEWNNNPPLSDEYVEKYGYLYTLDGALEAVPAGWRLPTDDDWKQLERVLGMSADEAGQLEWRGSYAGELMRQGSEGIQLKFQMSGYYTPYTTMGTSGYRFMGSYGFFWTVTPDENKEGNYYYYRKLYYKSSQVYRQSMEPNKEMLSVRFVRNAK